MMILKGVLVRDWMISPVISVAPGDLVVDAHKLMKDHGVRRLPVIKQDHLVGMITLGDIREASPSDVTLLSVWELNYLWMQLTVEKVMSHNLVTVQSEDHIIDAAQLMLDYQIGGLPVTNAAGAVIGMITESDIFKMVIHAFRQTVVAEH